LSLGIGNTETYLIAIKRCKSS